MDYMNKPMNVSDISSMYRHRIRENLKPYTVKVYKLNNQLVDDWEERVLKPMADSEGKVSASSATFSWAVYFEGILAKKYLDNQKMIPAATKDQEEYWKNFFEDLSIEEMHFYGSLVVSFGWAIIQGIFRKWATQEKWDKVYSKSKDPYKWVNLALKHKDLVLGKVNPWWSLEQYKEIHEKVMTILSIPIEPTN